MKYTPSSRDALDAHCREVIRSCLNIVEQHGDTYVAIHKGRRGSTASSLSP